MIYITGDTHGHFERIEYFCNDYNTTAEDILIILGDAGINFWLDRRDEYLKERLSKLPITLFCIHGNHEERPQLISGYEKKIWRGGTVFYEKQYPNILFAVDAEIYDFDVGRAIVIGGAYSIDKYHRLANNAPWFDSEQPDEETKDLVESRLKKIGWQIDFVFSHTGPLKYQPRDMFLANFNQSQIDKSTEEWLDEIEEKLTYELWYFGHFHCDREVDKAIILFEDVIELE